MFEKYATTAVVLKGSHEPWLVKDNIDAYATQTSWLGNSKTASPINI